jgi:hypothetical protein
MPTQPVSTDRKWGWRTSWSLVTSALVVAMAAWEVARQAWEEGPLDRRASADLIDFYEHRMAGVRHSLQERKVPEKIGYCYFLPSEKSLLPDYFASQYALAPWVLDWHFMSYDWVVMNVRMRSHSSLPPGFTVAEDFGDGVFLLKRDHR